MSLNPWLSCRVITRVTSHASSRAAMSIICVTWVG